MATKTMINLARIIIFLISLSLSLYSLFVATVTFRDLNFTLTITHLSKAIIIGYGIILVLIAPSGLWGIIGSILNNPELTIRYIRDHWFALIIISIIDIVKTIFPFINKDQVINDCLGPATMNDAADTAITNCQNDFDFNQRASWIIFGGQEVILVVLGIIAWRCQRNIGVKPGISNNKTKKDKKSKKSMKPSNDDNTIDQDSDLSSVIVQPSLSYINVKDNDNLDTSNFNNNDNNNNNNNDNNNNDNNDNDNENENSNSADNVINNNGINQEAARNYNSQNSTQLYQDLNSVSNIYPNNPNPTPNFYPNNPNPPPASLHQNGQLNTSDRQLLPPKRYNTLSLTSHNQNPYLPINSSRIQQVPPFQQQQKNYQKYTTYQQIAAATTNGNGNGNGNNNIPIPNFAQQPLIQYQQPQLQSQYSHHQQQQYQQLQQHNYIPNHNDDSQNGHVHTHRRSKSHPQLRPLPKPPGADESQIPQIPQIPIIPNSSSIIPIQPLSTPIRQQQLFQQFPDHQQRPIINDSRYVSQTPKRSSTSSRLHQSLPYQSLRSNSLPSAHKPKELLEQELSVAPPVPSISGSSGDNNDHSIPDSLIPGGNRSSVARKKTVAKSDNNDIINNNNNNNNNSLKKYVPPALSSLENGSKTALERFIHTYGNVTPESPSFRYSDVQPLPKPKSNDGENVTDKNNYNNKNSNINSINDSDNAKNVNRLRPKSAHSVKGEASPKFNVPSVYGGIPNGYYNNYYDNNLNNNNINNNINNSSSNSNNNNSHLQDKQFIPQSSYYYK